MKNLRRKPHGLRHPYFLGYWILLAIIWFSSLAGRALIHTDEGRYASISMGILQSGDWITPRLNGILYFEKPILQYWIGAISFSVFGLNEFAARFWPGLSGFLTVLAVLLTAGSLWGMRVGHLAALLVASTTWMIANSHFLTLDMGANCFLTLSLCGFILAQDDYATADRRRWLMWLCWAAMAGATMSKGLIGILIPGMTLVLYSIFTGNWAPWHRMYWLSGLAIFLALTAPWFFLVAQRNPGFAHFFFIQEHFQRFLTTEHHRTGPFWYFVPILLVGFLPWTSLIGALFREGRQSSKESFCTRRFLLTWCIFIFTFFSASNSKLPSYILPMFPAMGMLLALALEKMPAERLKKHLMLPAAVGSLLLFAYPYAAHFPSHSVPLSIMQSIALYLTIAAALYLAGTAMAWRALNKGRKTAAIMSMAMASVLAVSVGMAGHDSYGALKSSKGVVQAVAPYLRPDTRIFSVQTYDQTLPYYLGRQVTLVDYTDEFAFGESAEPDRWIPTLAGFIPVWNAARSAMAMMTISTYEALTKEGLSMKIVYQDERRLVVVKP